MKQPPAAALEEDYEDAIIEAATAAGWLAHAERRSASAKGYRTAIKGARGWPDLVLVHERRRIFLVAELKRRSNSPTVDQTRWLRSINAAGGTARLWWLPDQYPAILSFLTDPEAPMP